MPTDSTKKTRVVVDRELVEQAQAEAVRRGLGEKSPSLLVDMTLRAWLRSGLGPEAAALEGPNLAERVAELEANLARLAEEVSGRFLALEGRKPLRELPADAGRRQVVSERLQPPEPGPSPRRKVASKRPLPEATKRLPGGDLSTPEGLRAAMEAKGLSALALSEALGRRDRGRAVARWLDGSAQVPAKHRDKLGDLLA